MKSHPFQRASVSLRDHLEGAVFVGAEDITATDCQKTPERCREGSVLIVGVDSIEPEIDTIDTAIQRGIAGIVTERLLPFSIPQCLVPDARLAYAQLAMQIADNPCEKLLTIGVMGSHGKTTIALLISAMLKRLGGKAAYRTSLGCSNGDRSDLKVSSEPTALSLANWLDSCVKKQAPAAVVELSDSMLMQRSAGAIQFDVIVIPSYRVSQKLTSLETRGLETAMARACLQLKKHGLVIYNADDARLNRWIEKNQIPAIGYGLDADAEVRGKRLTREPGLQSLMVTAGNSLMPVNTKLIGDHHARHVLGAIATGYAFGLELHEVIGGVERMERIPGRMQNIAKGQSFQVYVDGADQADRLAVALHALSSQNRGRILCVAEVPEALDAEGRAAFGRVLERAASKVILTQSRKTRNAGQAEMWEVLDGCEKPAAIDLVPNRAAAIELALRAARPGDQVLLAGWGTNGWTAGNDRSVQFDAQKAENTLATLGESGTRTTPSLSVFP